MTSHLERDLVRLKDHLLGLGGLVEQAVERSARALTERRTDLAQKVIGDDTAIDDLELHVDEECLKVLALHQPVAADLRFITSVMKINNDLERIGDLAKNICERALDLARFSALDEPLDFVGMMQTARSMLHDSLDALVTANAGLAREVCRRDDLVDATNRRHFTVLIDRLRRDPESANAVLDYLTSSLHVERIADLATNIAEDVVFMVEAEVIRHQKGKASSAVA